jgi:hypothetical protein
MLVGVNAYVPIRMLLQWIASPCRARKKKYTRRGSNPQPSVPKTDALSN